MTTAPADHAVLDLSDIDLSGPGDAGSGRPGQRPFQVPAPRNAGPTTIRVTLPRPIAAFIKLPRIFTWIGLVVAAAGIVLIAIGWGDIAGTEVVGDQMPYLMSAGFIGLALVCIGVTFVGIDAKLTDSTLRQAQAYELRDALADLRAVDVEATRGEEL